MLWCFKLKYILHILTASPLNISPLHSSNLEFKINEYYNCHFHLHYNYFKFFIQYLYEYLSNSKDTILINHSLAALESSLKNIIIIQIILTL